MQPYTKNLDHSYFLSLKTIPYALLIMGTLALSGCTKKEESLPSADGLKTASEAGPREVNLSIWTEYISPDQVKRFTEKTGIKVNISNFASNEELLAKVMTGASGIDVAVPSDYMVTIMSKLDLLEKIEIDTLPNAKGINPDFLSKPYDPKNEFSVPYAWSTTGIAIRTDLYKGEIKTWKEFFEKEDLSGKMSVLDDVREVMAAALKSLGYSINTQNIAELNKAKEVVKTARKRIKMFRSQTSDALANKEIAVAQAYSTDANQTIAKLGSDKIKFVIPQDGGAVAIDNLVIVKGSKNAKEARELINFLLSLENNVEFVKKIRAGPVLTKTRELLPEDLKNNPGLFPPSDVLLKFEALVDLGNFTEEYDKAWTEIKSH